MKFYQAKLRLRSASASHWQADTIFGHLCWHLARSGRPDRLNGLLQRCEAGQPPILLSDGFPGEFLPRPILPLTENSRESSKRKRIELQRQAKRAGHGAWLRLDDFNRVRRGETPANPPTDDEVKQAVRPNITAKNQINRLTNTTAAGGELFDMEEVIQPEVTIYWRIEKDFEPMVREFLDDLKSSGYGKRKSVGYGQVESWSLDEFTFAEAPGANGFVSLSRFVPKPKDPTDGYWNVAVKYGKLGEEWALSERPFKKPLIQLACGSCFRDDVDNNWGDKWYGQLVSGLSTKAEVKHYGFAFLVPMRIAREVNQEV